MILLLHYRSIMPTYSFRCTYCNELQDVQRHHQDITPPEECPTCHSSKFQRIWACPTIKPFQGSAMYEPQKGIMKGKKTKSEYTTQVPDMGKIKKI